MSTAHRVIIGGILTIMMYGFMICMEGTGPKPAVMPNSPHFTTAMVYSELALTPAEVFEALGDPLTPQGCAIRTSIKASDTYDFLFMLAYTFFFAAIVLFYADRFDHDKKSSFYTFIRSAGIIMAVIMLFGDAGENFFKFRLDACVKPADIRSFDMTGLIVFTRIKWTLFFLMSMVAGYALLFCSDAARFKIQGVLYCIPALAGLCGVFVPPARFVIELAAAGIFIAWMISLSHAIGAVIQAKRS